MVVILVIWSFVKIENGKSKSATIIINIYIYLIVSKNRISEIDFDHFDLDHFDHAYFVGIVVMMIIEFVGISKI